MKIFILLLTLISQNLADNSVLGMQFRTQNAESSLDSATRTPLISLDSFSQKGLHPSPRSPYAPKSSAFSLLGESLAFSASSKKSADALLRPSTRFFAPRSGRVSGASHKFNADSANLQNSQNLVQNNPREAHLLKASSGEGVGVVREGEGSDFAIQAPAPSLKKNARSKKGELNADLSAQGREKKRDSSPLAQNDNLMKIAESSLDSANLLAMTKNKDFAESPQNTQISKLPQDEFALDSANCKNGDITGFWLSPRDKVSARTSIIKIFKKDGKYFAYNVAFLDELPPKKDALNQNFALRDREILGSVYAYNLERSGEASYINGRYYDFNKGKIFHLKAKLDCNKLILLISADNVGFLGKKKVYSAITKSEAEFYIKEHPTIDFSGVK